MNLTRLIVPVAAVAMLCACESQNKTDKKSDSHAKASTLSGPTPHVAGTPGPAQVAMFEKIKSLQGEWVMPGEDGKPMTTSIYTVTSNGSIVREVMMPGTAHEMTNVYHMDGPSVVVTHYCAVGNQPTMRATKANPDGSISFNFDSVSNLATTSSMYMGGLKLIMPDNNHLTTEWTSLVNGKAAEEHAKFSMTRKGA